MASWLGDLYILSSIFLGLKSIKFSLNETFILGCKGNNCRRLDALNERVGCSLKFMEVILLMRVKGEEGLVWMDWVSKIREYMPGRP